MIILRMEYPMSPGLHWMENRQDGKRYPVMVYEEATREEYEQYQARTATAPKRLPAPNWRYYYHASVD